MSHRSVLASAYLCLLLLLATWADAAAAPAEPAAPPVAILDTYSVWRMHQTLKSPVARVGGELKPLMLKLPWIDRETAAPASDWMQPDFDDHRWLRGSVHLPLPTAYVARLCLRGKFTVTDPARVRDLKLTVAYHGGVIVYVNGQEVARNHVARDETDLAEDYPAEAFLTSEGGLLVWEDGPRRKLPQKDPRRGMIERSLADVPIRASSLRPGLNVVAIEIVRAPYPDVVDVKKDPKAKFWNLAWDTCQINDVQLTAADAAGLVPNVGRPAGFQVWNSNLLAADYDQDFGDPNDRLRPIQMVGARNGSFSGKVVVGSTEPIRALKAIPGDLGGAGGIIPASQVRIRYGFPWGNDEMAVSYCKYPYPFAAPADMLSGLSDQAPDEIPVRAKTIGRAKPGTPGPVFGAVAPVWVTVHVPKETPPGAYKGEVTIRAEGQQPVRVPLEVKVVDWTLPDPQDYRTLVEMLQSPDTLALEYGVPLWSDRHWELIAESFRLISPSGSRFVYVPLIAETNFGHGESMVRWIKKSDGGYDYDFSIMEKYLDVAAENLGQPKIVVFYVWDVYMLQRERSPRNGGEGRIYEALENRNALREQGPVVTMLDAATGVTHNTVLPHYTDPASKSLWQPVFDQLRQRMAERGLDKAMMLGMMTDAWPSKEEVAFLGELAPNVPWVVHSHGGAGDMIYGLADTGYQIRVWGISHATEKSLLGWKLPILLNRYFRQGSFDRYPNSTWRYMCDFAISGNQRGVGRLGADFWRVLKDKKGQRKGRAYAAYPYSNWRNLDIYTSLLAPGPNGPGATQHLVQLLEGVQECEARIVVERAVSDPALRATLGDSLAAECEAALEERLRTTQLCFCTMVNRLNGNPGGLGSTGGPGVAPHYWCIGSGWEERAERIFFLAGQVERKLAEGH